MRTRASPGARERPGRLAAAVRDAGALLARRARRRCRPDPVRAAWFSEDEAQCVQEDWNLLYVAATRARQVLLVSGTAPARGTLDDTWYARLQAAESLSVGAAPAQRIVPAASERSVRDFLPEPLPTGQR